MARPEFDYPVIECKPGKEKSRLIREFQCEYSKRTGIYCHVDGKSQGAAKNLIAWYGLELSVLLVEEFFKSLDHDPTLRDAPVSLSCLVYNREHLLRKVCEKSMKESRTEEDELLF